MPPSPDERHYRSSTLMRIFAVVSCVLLLTIGLLFKADYTREWREYQQEFRDLDIAASRVKLDAAANKLEADPDYQALTEDLAKAREKYDQECAQLIDVKAKIAEYARQTDILDQRYKVAKAERDAAKFRYEKAKIDQLRDIAAKKAQYLQFEEEFALLSLKLEEAQTSLSVQKTAFDACGRQLAELKAKERQVARQADVLRNKLKKIDPAAMGFVNQLANMIRNLPIIDMANPSYKVQQVVLKDITEDVVFTQVPKVDRCISCHTGIDNPDYENAPQPFRTHPNLDEYVGKDSKHPMEEFGCTVCHNGRGRGTSFVSAAHTPSSESQAREWEEEYGWERLHDWDKPMFPKANVQAGCFQCHSKETYIRGAEKLTLGMNIIEKTGCYNCHTIKRYDGWLKSGPDLSHLAAKTDRDWAYRWIWDPKSFRQETWMPSFYNQSNNSDPESQKRGQQEVHAMVSYLFKNSKEFEMADLPVKGDPVKGKELVASIGCLACHKTGEEQPSTPLTTNAMLRRQGPVLSGLGTKTSQAWLYHWLKDPERYHPGSRMPNLRLSDEEAASVAAYLAQDQAQAFQQQTVPPVEEQELDKIVLGFLTKTMTQAQAEKRLGDMELEDRMQYAGQKLIAHYGCFSCHTIPGFETYKPIGTELTEEGSKDPHKLDFGFLDIERTRASWFTHKLKDPRVFDKGKVKPADEKLKMPNFDFSDEQIEAVVTVLLGFVNDRAVEHKKNPQTPDNIAVAKGQALVRQFNCKACHVIEGEGGAIQPKVIDWLTTYDNRTESEAQAIVRSFSPPDLVGEGKKVRAEWLFQFFHSPTTIRPWLKTRMPTYALKVQQRNALVRYFSALDKLDFPFTELIDTDMTRDEYESGHKLFSKDYFGCAQCHIVGDSMPAGSPDSWAPDFALSRERLKPDWIIQWLKNPQDLLPGTKMPTYFDPNYFDESGPPDILDGDEHQQIKILRDYILTLSEQPRMDRPDSAMSAGSEQTAEGSVPPAQPATP